MYVLRAFQRKGIGARLLRIMASDLVSRTLTAASLWVLRDNPVARRFYERNGAQLIDEREDVRNDAVLSRTCIWMGGSIAADPTWAQL